VNPQHLSTGSSNVVGATVMTTDPRIGATAAKLAPASAQFSVGHKHTFVFFGS
jgi:hypothetical protein